MPSEFLFEETEDGLILPGVHWESDSKDLCVVFIHGMSGNILENRFAHVLGKRLNDANMGFLYGHNRGYNHINDILSTKKNDTVRVGASYELFEECIFDIDLWIRMARSKGYKRIILMGHSLGCNKSIYYLHKNPATKLDGLILASPPDMVGLGSMKKYQPNYADLVIEASKNVESGNPRKILSGTIWDWYSLSSQTFLSLFSEGAPVDNLPFYRNPERFEQLESVSVPMLAFFGEKDDIEIRDLKLELKTLGEKAINCASYSSFILPSATHVYLNEEIPLADRVIEWIGSLQ